MYLRVDNCYKYGLGARCVMCGEGGGLLLRLFFKMQKCTFINELITAASVG